MKNKNIIVIFVGLFLLAVLSRWVAHFWNFTLVGGVFLFAGSFFKDKKIAVSLMLTSMLTSDFIIGFHDQMPSVYFGYLVIVGLGSMLHNNSARIKILGYSFIGALGFYTITNFAVWYSGQMYPMTLAGLLDCFFMAIPFYRNQLFSDLISSLALFELARYVLADAKVKVFLK